MEASSDDDAELELSPEEQKLSEGARNRKTFARAIRKRLRNKKDAIIVISGERGVGKSMLSIQLAKEICPRFDIAKHVLYDPKLPQLYDLVFNEPPHSVFVIDEAIKIGFSRRAMSANNVQLIEMLNLIRYKTHVMIMNVPLFANLDSSVRNLATYWVHVVDRGHCVIFRGDPDPFSHDPFHMKQSSELVHKEVGGRMALARFNNLMDAMRRCESCVGWMSFNDLPEEDKKIYEEHKTPYELKKTLAECAEERRKERLLAKTSASPDAFVRKKGKLDYVFGKE